MVVKFKVDIAAAVALSVAALSIGFFLFGMFAANRNAAAEAAKYRERVHAELINIGMAARAEALTDKAAEDLGIVTLSY